MGIYHMKLSIVSLLLTLLVFSLFIYAPTTNAETPSWEREKHVGTETELRNAVNEVTRETSVIIIFDRDIYLTETTLAIFPRTEVTLRSNTELAKESGVKFFRLIGVSDVSTITVESGGVLKLDGIIVTHNEGDYGRGVDVNLDSILRMTDGEISNNTSNHGGIHNLGSFTMSGGKILDNTATETGGGICNQGKVNLSGGKISGNTAETGGGVSNSNDKMSFTMSGGEITNNTARTEGGGVQNSHGSTFNLVNGVISGNTADCGGGVYNWNSNFFMSGGEITNNTATNTGSGGGGVWFDGGRFEMTDGVITGNRAPNGGGIYANNGRVQLSSGVISNNTASNNGGGIYATILEELYISDGMVFSDNQAPTAYERNPEHDEIYHAQIGANVVWTLPFNQGYNNYDISYTSGPLIFSNQTNPTKTPIYLIGLITLIICIIVAVLNFYFKKQE
jgi:predicted outer membrane repeat protein